MDEENLDRATLTCTDYYNGTLYKLDNTTVNVELRGKFDNGNNLKIVNPEEYSEFTPQNGYFNLYTTCRQTNYPDSPKCVKINSAGMMSSSGCSQTDRNYICKRG